MNHSGSSRGGVERCGANCYISKKSFPRREQVKPGTVNLSDRASHDWISFRKKGAKVTRPMSRDSCVVKRVITRTSEVYESTRIPDKTRSTQHGRAESDTVQVGRISP